MTSREPTRAHLVVGGFPPGSTAGHDMDYVRLRLLQLLSEQPGVQTTVANDYFGIEQWLPGRQLLVTYVAFPYLNEPQNDFVKQWLADGGRWLALHGTGSGRSERQPNGNWRSIQSSHHETLGGLVLGHPPIRKFRVDVADRDHPLTRGLPESFEVMDETYFIRLDSSSKHHLLLTTDLPNDPTPPPNFLGMEFDHTEALQPDGRTRVLGYTKDVDQGGVAYIALGHCHSPYMRQQPFVDASVSPDEKTPPLFLGSWETESFETLLRNGIRWGIGTY